MNAIHFWTGSTGVGKSKRMFDEISHETKEHPLGPYIYIITPTQNTLTYETEITSSQQSGSMRTGVFSFSRFIWHVMNEIRGEKQDVLSDNGHALLIYKLMEELLHEQSLHYYVKSADKIRFSEKILDMIKEFQSYNVYPEDLKSIDLTESNHNKFNDVIHIYERWLSHLSDIQVDGYDLNKRFTHILKEHKNLKSLTDAVIYIDGFHNFTESEMALIVELNKHVKQINILLLHQDLSYNSELFRKTNHVINRIRDLSFDGIEIINLDGDFLRSEKRGLVQLEDRLLNESEDISISDYDGIKFTESLTVHEEVHQIAKQIEDLTFDLEVNYRDVAVLYRDSNYVPLLESEFKKFGIDYQSDLQIDMIKHPFIKFLLSIFSCYKTGFQKEPFINLLKLNFLTKKEELPYIYTLENMILERGLSGSALKDDKYFILDGQYDDEGFLLMDSVPDTDTRTILSIKNRVLKSLERLFNDFNQSEAALDFAEHLYRFMKDEGVIDSIQVRLDSYSKRDEQFKSETLQVYNLFIDLLNDIVKVFPEKCNVNVLIDALEEALLAATFKLLPATIDQVTIGNLDLAKVENKKYVFLVGMTKNALPKDSRDTNIISDKEKDIFAANNIYFAPTSRDLAKDEKFVFYHAVTRATEGLFLSWSLQTLSGEATNRSPFIERIMPKDRQHVLNFEFDKTYTADLSPYHSVTSLKPLLPTLFLKLNQALRTLEEKHIDINDLPKESGYLEMNRLWFNIYKMLQTKVYEIGSQNLYDTIDRYLLFKNQANDIEDEVAESLYGDVIKGSVSRFESFNKCRFQHFSQYGLKLKVRKPFKIESLDTGILIHNVLEQLYREHQYKLLNIEESNVRQVVKKFVEFETQKISFNKFNRNEINMFLKEVTTERIVNTILFLRELERSSSYSTEVVELSFGMEDKKYPALSFTTENNNELIIRGKIDRIEVFSDADDLYFNIVDYKSSARSFSKRDVLMGVELQLLTYVYYMMRLYKGKNVYPNSFLYYPVIRKRFSDSDLEKSKSSKKALENALRPRGIFVSNSINVDDNIGLQAMSKNLNDLSNYYGFRISEANSTINGSDYKNKFMTTDILDKYLQYTVDMYRYVTDQIYLGSVRINPLESSKTDGDLPCRFCDFKNACRLDPVLDKDLCREQGGSELVTSFEQGSESE